MIENDSHVKPITNVNLWSTKIFTNFELPIFIHSHFADYGSYASKEVRVRRALARRDARAHTPSHHLPHPHTVST